MAVTAIHLLIQGRVQGVGYRAWAVRRAQALGLNGWVRNRADGMVEAVFIGDAALVECMITECHAGPIAARVTQIKATPWEGEIAVDFEALITA